MKNLLAATSLFFCMNVNAQSVQFSTDVISPQDKKLITGLSFPSMIGNNYYVSEVNGGGNFFDGGVRNVLYTFDANSLKKTGESLLNNTTSLVNAKDYLGMAQTSVNNRFISFFISKDNKNSYPVYYQLYDNAGKLVKEEKLSLTIDNGKLIKWNNKRDDAAFAAKSFNIRKNYDESGVIAASISKNIDKNNGVITIAEFDSDMNVKFTADYTIPLSKWMHYSKTVMGKVYNTNFDEGKVLDVIDDKNGFIYALVQTGDPKNIDEENLFWIYQFKKSDKSFVRTFKKEFSGNMMPLAVELDHGRENEVIVSVTGYEDAKDKRQNTFKTNSFFAGKFTSDGNLETLLNGKLSMNLLGLFYASNDSRQTKDDYIRSLYLRHVHVDKDGGIYAVWEQEIEETTQGAHSVHSYVTSANALVQYFGANKKILWEQPVYKFQVAKDMGRTGYSGMKIFYDDDKLYLFYPDDSKNSSKAASDGKIATYTLVKFGNKDLAGFFALSFNNKGLQKRNYISWPEDKVGFAINLNSIKYTGNSGFTGTARKIHQGATSLTEKEFTLLKFSFN